MKTCSKKSGGGKDYIVVLYLFFLEGANVLTFLREKVLQWGLDLNSKKH